MCAMYKRATCPMYKSTTCAIYKNAMVQNVQTMYYKFQKKKDPYLGMGKNQKLS